MRIEKKIWPKFYDAVESGEKKFELRLADFECKPGDTLVLKEWDPKKKKYTGRELEKRINYVMKTKNLEFYSREDVEKHGLQVLQLE